MLRVEFKGQPYDWFNLDEMGDVVKSEDFVNTLRENIVHYFGVPYDCQAICDEEGMLSSSADFARSLKALRPSIKVHDVREMPPEVKERTAHKLAVVLAEVARSQRIINAFQGVSAESGACGSSRPVSPWPVRVMEPEAAMVCPRCRNSGADIYGNPCACVVGKRVAAANQHKTGTPPRPLLPYGMLPPAGLPGVGGSWVPAPQPMPQPPILMGPHEPMGIALSGSGPSLRQCDMGLRPGLQDMALVMGRECVEVRLTKDPADGLNSRFGFANVPSPDGRHLLITWVDVNGLLERWNRSYPDRAVHEGDMIFAVNGAKDDIEAMRVQLQHENVHMLVRRGASPGPAGLVS